MNFDKIMKALSFFPYLGWLVGLYVSKAPESHDNARTSLVLSILVVIVNVSITAFDQLLPANLIFLSFVCNTVIYVITGVYLLFSLVACFFAWKGKVVRVPLITPIAYSLNI